MSRRLDRRGFLQGAGVLLSLPFLESLPNTSHASETEAPKRLVIIYQPQGMMMERWLPTATVDGFELGTFMTTPQIVRDESHALADLREELVILSGIDKTSAVDEGGFTHYAAAGHSLTGAMMLAAPEAPDELEAAIVWDAKRLVTGRQGGHTGIARVHDVREHFNVTINEPRDLYFVIKQPESPEGIYYYSQGWFIVLEYAGKEELKEVFRHTLKAAGSVNLLSPALQDTLIEHAAGNFRVLMAMAGGGEDGSEDPGAERPETGSR